MGQKKGSYVQSCFWKLDGETQIKQSNQGDEKYAVENIRRISCRVTVIARLRYLQVPSLPSLADLSIDEGIWSAAEGTVEDEEEEDGQWLKIDFFCTRCQTKIIFERDDGVMRNVRNLDRRAYYFVLFFHHPNLDH